MFRTPARSQPLRRPLAAAIAAALAMLTGAPASAVTYTWSGAVATQLSANPARYAWYWATPGNWKDGIAPVSSNTSDLIFGATNGGATVNSANFDSTFFLRSISFTSSTSYTLSGVALRLGAGGIVHDASSPQTIFNVVGLGGNQTWTLANGAGALNFNGGVNTSPVGTRRDLTINAAATNGTFNVVNGSISGSGSLNKTGAGALTLTGANTYTGGTLITAGVLNLGSAGALGSAGTLFFRGGTLQYTTANQTDYSNRFSPTGNQLYNIDTDRSFVTFASGLTSLGGTLTKLGTGRLTLTGANTYTGGTTLAAGTLEVGSVGALGSTGTVTFGGGTLRYTSANQTDYSARLSTAANQFYRIDTGASNSTTVSFASGLTSAGGALSKTGFGTLTLAGANTYTGDTTVSLGTLAITGSINSGAGARLTVDSLGVNTPDVALSGVGSSVSLGTAVVGLSGRGTFNQSGGSFKTNGNELIVGSNTGSIGIFNLGSNNTGSSLSTGNAIVGRAGNGTFAQSGGSFTTNGNTLTVGSDAGSIGTFNLSGSAGTSSLLTGNAIVGHAGSGTFAQSGGSFTANELYLGFERGASTTGTYNLSGGSLTTVLTQVSNNVNTSVFTQSGGTHTTSTLSLASANGAGSAGSYNLNGGLLSAGQVTRGGGAGTPGTSTFNFNGGTLRAIDNNGSFLQGLTVANVQAGGARVDTNGRNITIAQALLHDTTNGAPAIDGGLTKLGAGTLTLTGANTFTGALNLVSGTLAVAAESNLGASSTVTVGGGGALRFTGGVTLTRSYNLGVATLAVGSGDTLTFGSSAIVSGGFLSGPGVSVLGSGSTLNGVTALTNTALTQASGMATVNTSTLRGALTQTGGTLAFNNSFVAGSGRLSVGGTVNTTGVEIQGATTIQAGGAVANSDSSLYLTGGSRTTVNSGGTLSAASGTSIELNGSLLVNNGTQSGTLAINYGSLAKGAGSFGTVNVGDGGRFSPGNSPGTATAEIFSFGAGGRYDFELNTAHPRWGIDSDLLTVTNALSVGAGMTPNSVFTIAIHSLNVANQTAALSDFDSSRAYQFLLVDAHTVSGFAGASFNVDTSSFFNGLNGGSFSVSLNGNELYLDFNPAAAVPEPSMWALMLGGLAGLSVLRRRVGRNAPGAVA